MAQTAAERQAACRRRRPTSGENGEKQINTWVTTRAYKALVRLSRYHSSTQRAVLEQLIIAADDAISSQIDPISPEWDAYFVT